MATVPVPKLDSNGKVPVRFLPDGLGAVQSVAGKTGNVGLVKADVGLGSVDNTADTAKPVSTAQQSAIDAAKSRDNHTGSQAISTVTGLQSALDAKAGTVSPSFTGTVSVPAATVAGAAVNKGQLDAFAGYRTIPFSRSGSLTVAPGTGSLYNDGDVNWTIRSIRATVGVAPAGASVIVDVNLDGTTVFTTQGNRPTIAAGSTTSGKAVPDVVTVPPGGRLTVDVDQVGSTTAGSDLVVQVELSPGAGGGGGPITTSPRPAYLTVASNNLPANVKAGADFACDGVDDQVEINAALALATRPGDGFGGQGFNEVRLIGPDFSVADDNATSIKMYPNTRLVGSGWGTLITPKWTSSASTRGCIELFSDTTAHVQVADLGIGRVNAVTSNGSGIVFSQTGIGDAYQIMTGNDPFCKIENVLIRKMSQHGIYCTGNTGGAREMQIYGCVTFGTGGAGIWVESSSDSQISSCRTANAGTHGFILAGGNTKLADSKAYYAVLDGFSVTSSRCEVGDCAAQDNGRNGFNFTGANVTANSLVADSNQRLDQAGAGFAIGADGVFQGLNAFDRAQTPGSPQSVGIRFSGSQHVVLTGRISPSSGGQAVVGTPGSGSFMRVAVPGSALVTAG